jgi:5-methylcytosine-specific restriction endonuclease McrA
MPVTKLQAPVLVLNANFEPLNVCTTRRAIGLMLSEKAILVENGRGYIQSVSRDFPAPSIIRLGQMVRRPRPTIKLSKQEIFRRDQHTCQYCGSHSTKLTLDHIIPRHMGGEHSWHNLITACARCNHKKGGRTPEQAGMSLLSQPKAPSASARYIFGRYLRHNGEWEDYVEGW